MILYHEAIAKVSKGQFVSDGKGGLLGRISTDIPVGSFVSLCPITGKYILFTPNGSHGVTSYPLSDGRTLLSVPSSHFVTKVQPSDVAYKA